MTATLRPPASSSSRARRGRRNQVSVGSGPSHRVPVWLARVLVVVAVLALVQLAVVTEVLNPFFVPRPTQVAEGMARSITDTHYLDLAAVTLVESLIAFVVAAVLGLLVGFLLWRFHVLGKAFEPVVATIFASPIVMLYPIFLVVLGRNSTAIVALAVVFAVLPTILYTFQALNEVRRTLLNVGRSLDLTQWQLFRTILLPAAAPTIFTGLRVALTYVLIVVVAMEYILQIGGIGLSVAESSLKFRAVDLYVAVVLVIVISATFMWLIGRAQKVLTR